MFPKRCPICRELIKKGHVHGECYKKLRTVGEDYCMKCGRPLGNDDDELCSQCISEKHTYDEARTLWIYDDIVRKVISGLKYSFKKEYGEFLAQCLYGAYGEWIREIYADVIIPVPISRERMKERAFNQAEILAFYLSALTDLPMDGRFLRRIKDSKAQKNLTRGERARNLEGIMETSGLSPYKTVLLIDDIYTTGATADSCAGALKSSGVEKVYVLTLSTAGTYLL